MNLIRDVNLDISDFVVVTGLDISLASDGGKLGSG